MFEPKMSNIYLRLWSVWNNHKYTYILDKHGALVHIEAALLPGEGRGGEGWRGSAINSKMFTFKSVCTKFLWQ